MVNSGLPQWPALTATTGIRPRIDLRHLWTTRNLFAAAAVLAVMVSVGLPRYLTADPAPASELLAGTARGADIPLAPSAEPGSTSAPRAASGIAIRIAIGSPSPSPPAPPSQSGVMDRRARGPATAPLPGLLTSMRVVHQHRLGSCRGLLIVSRDGLAFVPDDTPDQARDGFNLLHHEFLHALEGDSLMVRSADRAYRFRSDGEGGAGERLATLVESIAQVRKRPCVMLSRRAPASGRRPESPCIRSRSAPPTAAKNRCGLRFRPWPARA